MCVGLLCVGLDGVSTTQDDQSHNPKKKKKSTVFGAGEKTVPSAKAEEKNEYTFRNWLRQKGQC